MSQRSLIEINHDLIDRLLDDNGVVAKLIFDAVCGNPASAEKLRLFYGIKLVTQHHHSDSVVIQINGNTLQPQRTA